MKITLKELGGYTSKIAELEAKVQELEGLIQDLYDCKQTNAQGDEKIRAYWRKTGQMNTPSEVCKCEVSGRGMATNRCIKCSKPINDGEK